MPNFRALSQNAEWFPSYMHAGLCVQSSNLPKLYLSCFLEQRVHRGFRPPFSFSLAVLGRLQGGIWKQPASVWAQGGGNKIPPEVFEKKQR